MGYRIAVGFSNYFKVVTPYVAEMGEAGKDHHCVNTATVFSLKNPFTPKLRKANDTSSVRQGDCHSFLPEA
jgi:hypothetical protein